MALIVQNEHRYRDVSEHTVISIECQWSYGHYFVQTMHRLIEMLSKANVNYTETNFDDKRDLEQLVHPYVCFVYLSLDKKKLFSS